MGQSILRDREAPFQSGQFFAPAYRKGIRLRFRNQDVDTSNGNVNELGNTSGGPGKSSLFSLTTYDPEIGLSGDRVNMVGRAWHLCQVRCVLDGP